MQLKSKNSFHAASRVAFALSREATLASVLIICVSPFVARAATATAAPLVTPVSATYNTTQTITITDTTANAVIYYTTNNTNPTTSSPKYTGPFTVSASTTIRAMAQAPGYSLSAATVSFVTIVLPTAVPLATPPPGTYNAVQSVKLTNSTPGATIYYTTNGVYPTTSSPTYSAPIQTSNGMQITAFAAAPGYSVGSPMLANYKIIASPPVITPAAGTLQKSATVTMSDAIPGATIYYTSDGSLPTTSSPVYAGPITVAPAQTSTMVYQAMAVAPGCQQSPKSMATFTVDQPAGALAQATVSTNPTKTIAPNFMGLSMNWAQPALMMGKASTGANTVYRQLLKNLLVNSTAPMLLRITGDDSNLADIQAQIEPLAELAAAVNVNFTLGVDQWNGSLTLAEQQAAAWKAGIPNNRIAAFEIGNEPDVYPYVSARPLTYSWANYLAEFQQWQLGVLSTVGSGFEIMGPSMGQETHWVPNAEVGLINGTFTPNLVSQHAYVGGDTQDGNSTTGQSWPPDSLLKPASAVTMPELFEKYAAAAHKSGRVFRMGEVNSFWGGLYGLSNSFSSSLWSIDYMFNFLNDGMDGVNWNTDQGVSYSLFAFAAPLNAQGIAVFQATQVNPLYYGLLAFSHIAGNNAKLLPVTTTTAANVSIWATIDDTTAAHVVVINKDETAAGSVEITLPGYSTGTVRYLLAANYSATNGVTWGGQTFDGTPDGTIQGTPVTTTITPINGIFTIPNLPITSAAVIDFTN